MGGMTMHLIPNDCFPPAKPPAKPCDAKPRGRSAVRALRLPRFLAWQVPVTEREAERPTDVPGGKVLASKVLASKVPGGKVLAGKRQRQTPAMSNNPGGTHACNTELTSN